jgi:hypothetical protein
VELLRNGEVQGRGISKGLGKHENIVNFRAEGMCRCHHLTSKLVKDWEWNRHFVSCPAHVKSPGCITTIVTSQERLYGILNPKIKEIMASQKFEIMVKEDLSKR